MLLRTHDLIAPWTVVLADHKKTARINLVRNVLSRLEYDDKDDCLVAPDPEIVFDFSTSKLEDGRLAK